MKNGQEPVDVIAAVDDQQANDVLTSVQKISFNLSTEYSSYFGANQDINGQSDETNMKSLLPDTDVHSSSKNSITGEKIQENVEEKHTDILTKLSPERQDRESAAPDVGLAETKAREQQNSDKEEQLLDATRLSLEYKSVGKMPRGGFRRIGTIGSAQPIGKAFGVEMSNGRLKHVKSQLYDSAGRNGHFGNINNAEMVTKSDIVKNGNNSAKGTQTTENKEIVDRASNGNGRSTAETQNEQTNKPCDCKFQPDFRIQMLEEELREAATLEIGLYSVVAEHGSSVNKVHAPARRLARFYLCACKEKSQDKQASAARAAISGLVLVSKACGNDVPRLTFWLSNAIMLRAIISQAATEIKCVDWRHSGKSDGRLCRMLSSVPRRSENYSSAEESEKNSSEESDDWGDIETFIFALEKTESWVFSRIVESIWWQTLTPHMQTAVAKTSARTRGSSINRTSKYGLGDQEQGNFSTELWKRAFKDACERLCPIRAEGHECGCLPAIARMVMEQLVGRLDVAMFNAILRESSEEMPSDPVSDPISDSRVLPIPAGKLCFGAGAQLKNAIGNWSRWLSDLFGIEDSESPEDNNMGSDDKRSETLKPFPLLNSLSDLMMLPLEMLTDIPTRKEVCPVLGPMLIKKALISYTPDEFCPNPIPRSVIEALDYEDASNDSAETATSYPCGAPPTVYSPPSETSLSIFIREVGNRAVQRSGSYSLRKLYTSDDELDELDSPLSSIITDNFQCSSPRKLKWITKGNDSAKVSRYQLLREVWKDFEQ